MSIKPRRLQRTLISIITWAFFDTGLPPIFSISEKAQLKSPAMIIFSCSQSSRLFRRSLKKTTAQYGDDGTIFVRDQSSVSYLVKLADEFKEVSGLEINPSKTEALWLGAWRDPAYG